MSWSISTYLRIALVWFSLALPLSSAHALFLGTEAAEGQFPSTVAIMIPDETHPPENIDLLCTGSRISDRLIMTAGHCMFSPTPVNGTYPMRKEMTEGARIVLAHGVQLWKSAEGYRTKKYSATIRKRYIHPSYDASKVSELLLPPFEFTDLAILELDESLPLDEVPIAPLDLSTLQGSESLIIGGYGMEWHHGQPNRLKFAKAQVKSLDSGMTALVAGIEYAGVGPATIMPGDSGGPAYLEGPNGALRIVGVNSRLGEVGTQYLTRIDFNSPGKAGAWLQDLLSKASPAGPTPR